MEKNALKEGIGAFDKSSKGFAAIIEAQVKSLKKKTPNPISFFYIPVKQLHKGNLKKEISLCLFGNEAGSLLQLAE